MKSVFQITSRDPHSFARTGVIQTNHGLIKTPAFAPDATYGAVKYLSSQELTSTGLQFLLANIYHLGLRPGPLAIKKLGGLHQLMAWPKPIITDSGGFQVFSLIYKNKMGKILPQGAEFRDHLSGAKHLLTPQKSINNQLKTDSDILMVLDYPIINQAPAKDNQTSVRLTTKWAKLSWQAFQKSNQAKGKILMAIIQGADDPKMRKKSFTELEAITPFAGYGFGGPPLNEDILASTARLIPDDRIRYVMGAGTPQDIIKAVKMGWDLFDCVIPTRNARHGLLYTFKGEVKINQQQYSLDKKPIEAGCPCFSCQNYSRAYIHHLLKVKEPLGYRLATLHNLTFYGRLMKKIRENI